MQGGAGDGVQDSAHQTAVDHPDGVVGRIVKLTREYHPARFDGEELKSHYLTHGGWWESSVDDGLQVIQPGHRCTERGSWRGIVP